MADFKISELPKGVRDIPDVTRDDLARALGAEGFNHGVEMGVERGHYSKTLLKSNPNLKLICVDAWLAYRGYREHVSQDKLDGFFVETKERLKQFGSRVSFVRDLSVVAATRIPNRSLDFVYLDGNHSLPQVIADLAAWEPKVRSGGVVAGHDYRRDKKDDAPFHVPYALGAWTSAYHIKDWWILRGERSASWLWVKS